MDTVGKSQCFVPCLGNGHRAIGGELFSQKPRRLSTRA